MIRSGKNFGNFLPRRLLWGIVIVVLILMVDFVLPRHLFFHMTKNELNLADRKTFQQLVGMSKAELQNKLGPPTAIDTKAGTWSYQLPTPPRDLLPKPTYVGLSFDQADRCSKYWLYD